MDIEDITKELDEKSVENYMSILMMVIHNRFANYTTNVDRLYSIVGFDKFVEIVKILGGRKIPIPTKNEMEDAILFTTVYYYREVKKMDWDDIQKELPDEPNIMKRFYKRVYTLNNELKEHISNILGENNEINI